MQDQKNNRSKKWTIIFAFLCGIVATVIVLLVLPRLNLKAKSESKRAAEVFARLREWAGDDPERIAKYNEQLDKYIDAIRQSEINEKNRNDVLSGRQRNKLDKGINDAVSLRIASWRKLKRNMQPVTVKALLGEPQHISVADAVFTWEYECNSYVTIINNAVSGWSEPEKDRLIEKKKIHILIKER